MIAPVVAAIDSELGSGIHDGGVVRMYEQRPDLWLRRQAVGDAVPVVFAFNLAKQPAFGYIFALARESDVDVGSVSVVRHEEPPG